MASDKNNIIFEKTSKLLNSNIFVNKQENLQIRNKNNKKFYKLIHYLRKEKKWTNYKYGHCLARTESVQL